MLVARLHRHVNAPWNPVWYHRARYPRSATGQILFHWRTAAGEEVDLVIEVGGRLVPIEMKATGRPRPADAAYSLAFRAEYGKRSRLGLLLHSGSALGWLAPDVLAVPWWRVI